MDGREGLIKGGRRAKAARSSFGRLLDTISSKQTLPGPDDRFNSLAAARYAATALLYWRINLLLRLAALLA